MLRGTIAVKIEDLEKHKDIVSSAFGEWGVLPVGISSSKELFFYSCFAKVFQKSGKYYELHMQEREGMKGKFFKYILVETTVPINIKKEAIPC